MARKNVRFSSPFWGTRNRILVNKADYFVQETYVIDKETDIN